MPAIGGLKKDSDRAITPGMKQSVTLHTLHCAIFTLNSLEGRAAIGKRNLVSMRAGLLQSCPTLCNPVDCGLPGFSVRGVLQARIPEYIGQYWLPYPSRALYFLLP